MKRIVALALLALSACSSAEIRKNVAAECRSSSDCSAGQTCVRGLCEETTPTLRCNDDFECPSGQACMNGACQIPPRTPGSPPSGPGRDPRA
jgi:hypothetical protein